MSQIQIDYNYAGFKLLIEVDAYEGRPATQIDPPEEQEFTITAITLDGKCAFELIGWESWTECEQLDFEQEVEAHYIEMNQ